MIMKIENGFYDRTTVDLITGSLTDGEIIIMPSDTIYGFLCVPSQEKKLRIIKNRDDKPFIHLIDDYDKFGYFGLEKNQMPGILSKNWPGPFTFILKNKDNAAFGIRMPDWDVLIEIIRKCGVPLLSTSVNMSGSESTNDIGKIVNLFGNKADLIIDDRKFEHGIASTIVDLTSSEMKILRQGSFPLKTCDY
jgi:L-threonylcarbamoyladenylate synthase